MSEKMTPALEAAVLSIISAWREVPLPIIDRRIQDLRDEAARREAGDDRRTFAIPEGHEAVRDADGRATGETRPTADDLVAQFKAQLSAVGNYRPPRPNDVATLAQTEAALLARLAASRVPEMPELNDDLIAILGRPNFMCITLANAFRQAGQKIKEKSQHEQAAVIHWLLGLYFKHGAAWAEAGEAELKRMAAAPAPEVKK